MMKSKLKRLLAVALGCVMLGSSLAGCGSSSEASADASSKEHHGFFIRPYAKPIIVQIQTNETAILIDLKDNEKQEILNSEQNMKNAMITQKEVVIPQEWVQTGRWRATGYWKPTQKVVKVSRAVETREWNQAIDGGTSTKDQAIYAESKESIGFSQGINIAAQLNTPSDAIKFMFCYNADKSLADVLDTEVRAAVESKFNEICGRYKMEEIISIKADIMNELKETIIPQFAERGITITTLGYKEGIEYEDPAIQEAINKQITSDKAKVTAANEAEKKKIEAQGAAEAAKIEAESKAKVKEIDSKAEAEANKRLTESLSDKVLEAKRIEANKEIWKDKELPETVVGSDAMSILGLGNLKND